MIFRSATSPLLTFTGHVTELHTQSLSLLHFPGWRLLRWLNCIVSSIQKCSSYHGNSFTDFPSCCNVSLYILKMLYFLHQVGRRYGQGYIVTAHITRNVKLYNASINAELNFSLLQNICDCALYYVGAVYESLNDPDLYDESGRFRATEKVTQGFVFLSPPAEGNCFSHHLLTCCIFVQVWPHSPMLQYDLVQLKQH